MKKREIVEIIKTEGGYPSFKEAEIAMDTVMSTIISLIKTQNRLQLDGLGVFTKVKRKATTKRNPRTGEKVDVPERTALKFKASRGLIL